VIVADPAAAIVAGRQIGAGAESRHFGKQRVLHACLAAEFDEGGHAVAQQFGDREARVERKGGLSTGVAVLEIARIAFDYLAFPGNADLEKGLAEIHRPTCIGDEPVRRAVPGMDMGVDETGRHQLVRGVDCAVDRAVKGLADMNDPVPLIHDDAVADQPVMAGLVPYDPTRLDRRAHRHSPVSQSAFSTAAGIFDAQAGAAHRP
jgi:hypothetical protein